MVDVAEAVFLKNRTASENISSSRRTIVHCVKEMNNNLLTELNNTVQTYMYCSIALDDSTDTSDTAQLLILI